MCSDHELKSHRKCVIELIVRLTETAHHGKKKMECVIRGYHVYRAICAAPIVNELVCTREARTMANRYALTVMNEETIIAHLPRKIHKLEFSYVVQ